MFLGPRTLLTARPRTLMMTSASVEDSFRKIRVARGPRGTATTGGDSPRDRYAREHAKSSSLDLVPTIPILVASLQSPDRLDVQLRELLRNNFAMCSCVRTASRSTATFLLA